MKFTYEAYKSMILLLIEHGYTFCDYFNYEQYMKSVIMRHDVDNDLEKALEMSAAEYEIGITSTYFVMTTSNFYNIFSKKNREILKVIGDYGHSIGLHFDEMQYNRCCEDWWIEAIDKEISLLEQCVGREITSVSMHRPSKETLQADWNIRNGKVINSYGKKYMENHKYLSDSRRDWKENVLDIIGKEQYSRLHILAHPFWYREREESAKKTLYVFCREQMYKCYDELDKNMRSLNELLEKNELSAQEEHKGWG